MKTEDSKMAPVQGYTPGIPWSMHLEAYDVYRKKYGAQQALIEGGCRGGFGTRELDDFIPGWRDKVSEIGQLRAALQEHDAEIEQLRVQLAGCGVAAMQNTESSKAERAKRGDFGWSESYGDVCRMVDREIELRAKLVAADIRIGNDAMMIAGLTAETVRLANKAEAQDRVIQIGREAVVKIATERDALQAKFAALEKQDRHVRRLLCIAVADRPYMDDGEASDQEIDYLREPPADIERKLQERGKKRLAAAGAAPPNVLMNQLINDKVELQHKLDDALAKLAAGAAPVPIPFVTVNECGSHHYTAENVLNLVRYLRACEDGTEVIKWQDKDPKTFAGVLWRVIQALSHDVPYSAAPVPEGYQLVKRGQHCVIGGDGKLRVEAAPKEPT